ncbi:hypothetical protein AB3S75_034392 [Citrus x aurantiifolia]
MVWEHELGKKSIRKWWVIVRERCGFRVLGREDEETKEKDEERQGNRLVGSNEAASQLGSTLEEASCLEKWLTVW